MTDWLRTNVSLNRWSVASGGVLVRVLAAWYWLKHVEQRPGAYRSGHARGWFWTSDAVRLIADTLDVSLRTSAGYIEAMVDVGLATLDVKKDRIFLTGWSRAVTDVADLDAVEFDATNVNIPVKALRKLGTTKSAFTQSWHHDNRASGVASRSTLSKQFNVSVQSLRNYEQTADVEGFTTDVQPVIFTSPLPNTDVLHERHPDTKNEQTGAEVQRDDILARTWFKCAKCQYASKDGSKAVNHVQRYHPGADVESNILLASQGANRYVSSLPTARSGQLGQLKRNAAKRGQPVSSKTGSLTNTSDSSVAGQANGKSQLFWFNLRAAKAATLRTGRTMYWMRRHTTQHDDETSQTRWTAQRIDAAWFRRTDSQRAPARVKMVLDSYDDKTAHVRFVPIS